MALSEEHIIKGCKRCDISSQKALYDLYNARFRALVRRYILDPDDAKDVLQESFLLIFKNIGKYSGTGSFEGWMKRIVINASLQHIKKNQHKTFNVHVDDIDLSGDEEPAIDPVDRADGHEMAGGFDMAVAANLRHDELLDIIAALPSEFQQVFNMSVIDQLSHAEIAQMLNIDIVTSRTRLARARKRVQTELHARCLEILCV